MSEIDKKDFLKIIELFVSDIYYLLEIALPGDVARKEESLRKDYPGEKEISISLKIISIKDLLFNFIQKKVSPKIYILYANIINSISYFRHNIKCDLDKKNSISFFVNAYCVASSLEYIFFQSEECLKRYKKFPYLDSYFKENQSCIKHVIENFLNKIWKENFVIKKFDEVMEIILEKASNEDFMNDYEKYKSKKTTINKKKKEKCNKKNDSNEKSQNKIEENTLNENVSLSEININNKVKNDEESKLKKKIDNQESFEEEDFEKLIHNYNIPDNFMFILSSMNEKMKKMDKKITKMDKQIKHMEENQKLLWSYFSLVSNSRDLFKSIPFYLYKYMGFSGELDNYKKLSRIICELKENKNKFPIRDEILLKFLNFENFLLRMFNLLLHREFKFNNNKEYDELDFIPKNNFEDCFDNMITFIDNIVEKQDIQRAIKETIDKIKIDINIESCLKYEEGTIFKIVNSKFIPVITKNDIESVRQFLKSIKIENEEFSKLCETKIWNNFEYISKPVFYYKDLKLDE